MKLIVVTPPTFFVEEDQIITALFEEGLDILHLRKPATPAMYSERLLTLLGQSFVGLEANTVRHGGSVNVRLLSSCLQLDTGSHSL